MRIDRIRVDGFGRLTDFDTGPGLGSLVVVLGPNEAGKSTLFSFLTTALYGFHPASREGNPHVPWGAAEAAGRITLQLEANDCAEVERRLRSQPSGRLAIGGRTSDLRNQPLPWVEHVPRTVFRQVFAVTLRELAGLDGETWARIQDKVLGSMGASDLRSARAVADALELEAGALWRPNRRGNQRLRDLQTEIRALRSRRKAAGERDVRIRTLVEERDAVRTRLQEVRELRQRDRAGIDRAQTLLPLKRQLDRIAALRAEGGSRGELNGLPADPPRRLAELEAEHAGLEERRQGLDQEVAEREATIDRLDDRAHELIARRDEIGLLVARAAACSADRARAREVEAEVRDLEARLDAASDPVLDGSWRTVSSEALMRVPIALLRERISGARRPPASASPVRLPWVATVVAVGFGLLVWGLATGQVVATVLGAALSGGGVAAWLLRARVSPRPTPGAVGPFDIAALLPDMPVRQDHLARPSEALVAGLDRLRTLVRQHDQLARAAGAVRDRIAEVDDEARRLAVELHFDREDEGEVIAHMLDRDLHRAEQLRDDATVAERESHRLRRERHAAVASLERLGPALTDLREAGVALGRGSAGEGLEEARARLAAHQRADQLQDELERLHPGLDELKAQIDAATGEGDAWTIDDDELVRAQARVEGHEDEIEELVRRGEALESEAAQLRELETVDAVDGETDGLREEEARLTRERDRKWVLAQLLREADRRFREAHQPDLLRRAGSYLEHLTGGRYERLVVDETDTGDLFRLVGPGLPAPVALAPPVSTGTLEQAYLSLRLAIVDHLDQGGERLPLFVDEVFVNWDRERRARGLEVVAGLSGSRQVFVFTCHPAVAEELEHRGGSVLRLDPAA